ncbi:MAG: rhomboid family intramembrane serine protease [Verrucomicrobiota bacterium]
MRSSWNQSHIGGGRERFSDSFRGWFSRFGSVTHFIIFLTAVVYVAQLVCAFIRWDVAGVGVMEYIFGLNGDRLAHGLVWQPLTYMLLHDGIWHILINLLLLWMFGREVEYFIGPKPFAKLYLLAGALGGALWLAFNFNEVSPLGGASAAVLGCVIAFATLFPERELTFLVFFVIPVTMRAKYMALIAIAFDIVPLLTHTQSNVAHLAHLGGAALGYLYIKSLGYGTTPRWLGWLHQLETRRQPKPAPRTLSPDEFMRQEIDPILDKISREGMQSLTKRERKILESAKDVIQKPRR